MISKYKPQNIRSYLVLYAITASLRKDIIVDSIRTIIEGGATIIQLRNKNISSSELILLGNQLHSITSQLGVPLIINDFPLVAAMVGAEGVHVGQEDISPQKARQIIGFKKILGISVATLSQAKAAEPYADYLGAGPIFPTESKLDAILPIGIKNLKEIVQAVSIPVVAIGGININNIIDVMKTGVAGVAVISAIWNAKDPRKATRELSIIINKYKKQ